MTSSSGNRSGAITFIGALGLLFIGLRLGHAIGWSWWLVTLPLWGGFALIGAAVLDARDALKRRRNLRALRNDPVTSRRTPISGRRDER